jgi:asparagine synthase (glutamine-hydrolysing)
VEGERTVAVAFSGGVDSSVLVVCARRRARVVACTAFSGGARDEEASVEGAKRLGVEHATARLTGEVVARELARMELPFQPTPMDMGLWCLYSSVAQVAAGAGARVMLLGQLADELFGGYAKYARALQSSGPDAAKGMMRTDFADYWARGRSRDVGACAGWVEPRLPYGEPEVAAFAEAIPLSYKITSATRKAVLRRAGVILGLPEDMAGAAKKAAQYSSGVQRLVDGARF